MKPIIYLNQYAHHRFLGSRYSGQPIRDKLETLLLENSNEGVILDFDGVSVTQSFIDEVIGFLILKYGANILKQIVFKNCSQDVKAILNFVSKSRVQDYIKSHQT